MTDQELNDGCARAMGWEEVVGLPMPFAPLDGGWRVPGKPGVRYGFDPATDWRDTGIALEWLAARVETLTVGVNMVTVVVFNDAGWPDVREFNADTTQRAICLAAVEVGKRESI